MRLKGKVALVTGAARGLGLAIAARLAKEGAVVWACDVDEAGGGPEAEARGLRFLRLDVTSEPSWIAALEAVVEGSGGIDILVNNAGINIRKPIEEMGVEEFDRVMAVNVRGPFIGIKHTIPLMRSRGGGSIVNVSSVCGLIGHLYTNEAYTTSKGALTLLTKSVATRYAKDNIRANSVHPSTVDTPLVRELFADPERRKERLEEIPLKRLASADDVAEAVLFLASPESSFLNGVALPVDGGLTAY